MSPSAPRRPPLTASATASAQLFAVVGARIRDERRARRLTLRALAARAHLSPAAVQSIESGRAGSVDAYARLATALNLRLEIDLVDPRRRAPSPARQVDLVHSAMGEFEVAHLRPFGYGLAVDEPYQHFQFAGRADVIAWDADKRALLHIENRTRFPDLQETAGSFNAKRAYLGRALAERLNLGRWRSETHVIAALWSAEVLHTLRLRTETFRALCPTDPAPLEGWWSGTPPSSGLHSCLVVLDPAANSRQRQWIDLNAALTAKPRHRGYADAASAIMSRGE